MRRAATAPPCCSCSGPTRATGRSGISRPSTSAPAPRRRQHSRRAAAGDRVGRRAQPIAANVDQVVVVAATRDPELNPRMLDRFLVIAEANRLPAVIVLNKIELDRAALAPLVARYAPAGYQVLA